MNALGHHVLIELWDCNARINDPDAVRTALLDTVQAIGATLIHQYVHAYSPHGVTGLALLAESHLSIHTWPERRYVAADVFTCGQTTDPQRAVAVLVEHFCPTETATQVLERGVRPAEMLKR